MRREVADLIGSGLLLAALVMASLAVLAPTPGASTVPSSAPVAASSELVERGRMLFYAKGCVGCHMKAGESGTNAIGPNLTGLHIRAAQLRPDRPEDYVRESINDPSAYITTGYAGGVAMPDLSLSDDEIDALTAFLLDQR